MAGNRPKQHVNKEKREGEGEEKGKEKGKEKGRWKEDSLKM